jgi:hypothetical protein
MTDVCSQKLKSGIAAPRRNNNDSQPRSQPKTASDIPSSPIRPTATRNASETHRAQGLTRSNRDSRKENAIKITMAALLGERCARKGRWRIIWMGANSHPINTAKPVTIARRLAHFDMLSSGIAIGFFRTGSGASPKFEGEEERTGPPFHHDDRIFERNFKWRCWLQRSTARATPPFSVNGRERSRELSPSVQDSI